MGRLRRSGRTPHGTEGIPVVVCAEVVKIVQQDGGPAEQSPQASLPMGVQQGQAPARNSDQFERLIKASADQALVRRAGSVACKEPALRLLNRAAAISVVPEAQVRQELPNNDRGGGPTTVDEVHQEQTARDKPDMFQYQVAMRERGRLLRKPIVELVGAVEKRVDHRARCGKQRGDEMGLVHNLADLPLKAMESEQAGERLWSAVQHAHSLPDDFKPPPDFAAGAPQVFVTGRAG